MEDEHEPDPRPALKDKINQAFDTLHPADRGPYSNREVVSWLAENAPKGESSLSLNYLLMLRSGERDNPTLLLRLTFSVTSSTSKISIARH